MSKQNLHTHTIYGDGVDTPQEIIEKALEKGFTSIGFSEHSYMPASPMFKDGNKLSLYIDEINKLKKKYENRIEIFLGLEYEMLSGIAIPKGLDYTIGSIHYLKINGEYVGFDKDENTVYNIINKYFGGNGMAYAKAYYEGLSGLYKYGKFDIIGHFDIITKHSNKRKFFDENSDEYLSYAVGAAEALRGKIEYFEVNTGAIARGYKKDVYPSEKIIKELKKLEFKPVITSDCHNKNFLDESFHKAEEMLRKCGFKEKYILTESGFKSIALQEE